MTTTATHTAPVNIDTGRDLNIPQLRAQLGMDLMAASGGRIRTFGPSAVSLPVSNGYAVVVILEADDTYTVQRTFTRSGVIRIKGAESNVYADQVGDSVYRASCFRNVTFG